MSVAELHQANHPWSSIDSYPPHTHSDKPVSRDDYDASIPIWERAENGEQSIFESYNPINDAERLRDLEHLPSEQKDYYICENVISYLEEFVGEIPVKKLAGILQNDGNFTMLGVNVTDMYERSAHVAGKGSREDMEKRGLDLIMDQLNQGANRAFWISPPKLADYGFVFSFVADPYDEKLQGRPIRELLLRYDEESHSVEQSTRMYHAIQQQVSPDLPVVADPLLDYGDFLAHPIIYHTQDENDASFLFDAVGISANEAERSEVFRKTILPEITPLLHRYSALIQEMSQLDLQNESEQVRHLKEEAHLMIGAMFNIARAVRRLTNEHHTNEQQYHRDRELLLTFGSQFQSREMMMLAASTAFRRESLTITGGSNCLVTQQIGRNEEEVLSRVTDWFSVGASVQMFGLEKASTCGLRGCRIRSPHFHCPSKNKGGCGGAIPSGKGIRRCPHCGLDKDDYLGEKCD